MRKIKLAFIPLIAFSFLLAGCSGASDEKDQTGTKIVYFEGIPYSGKITDVEKGAKQIFNSDDQTGKVISITGTWTGTGFDGEAEIELTDHSQIYVEYKKERAEGEAKRIYEDGNYDIYNYQQGYPTGRVVSFDRQDVVKNIDFYYNNRTIGEWCEMAEKVELTELLKNTKAYQDEPIKFEGIITDILDSAGSTYIAVKNTNNETIICTYQNTKTQRQQALVPRMQSGEKVTVYGFYDKTSEMNCENKFSVSVDVDKINLEGCFADVPEEGVRASINNDALLSTLPFFELIYAESEAMNKMDFKDLAYDQVKKYEYDSLVTYPYYYNDFELEDQAEVIYLNFDYVKRKGILLLQNRDAEKLYYAEYTAKEEEKVPVLGDILSFTADLNGCYKMLYEDKWGDLEYISIPWLEISALDG